MKVLEAVNYLLVSIGQEVVEDLSQPDALMAKQALDFVMGELPYDAEDFAMDYERLPLPVYNYVVIRAGRKFQTNMVSSEVLHQFTQEDEANAKRLLIRKKIIPKALKREVEEELNELLSFAAKVPQAIKENLALLKLQALLYISPEEYVLSEQSVTQAYVDFKKRLIVTKEVPMEVLKATAKHLFGKYGFSGVIPIDVTEPNHISATLRAMAAYEFQKSILAAEDYVIADAEKNQDELDLRLAIIANRLLPSALYARVENEFISTYGYTQSELTSIMEEYIYQKAMFRLQSILVPDERQRPISIEDMDNAEASLITNLIVPKAIYARAYAEIKLELGIAPEVSEEAIPEAVKVYARYKGAFIHQPTAIMNPRKYVISEETLMRAKALAGQSLPTLSLMSAKAVSRIVDKETSPSATSAATKQKYRLEVKV